MAFLMEHKATRYNEGKTKLSFILEAGPAIEGAAKVMEFGAQKYERNNWKKGLNDVDIIDSLLRHLVSYLAGEKLDEESGLPHVDHLLCNAIFLAYHYNGRKNDSISQS